MTAAEWIARAHAVTDGATPGPWAYATAPAEGSDETKAEYMAGALTDEGPLYALFVPATVGDERGYLVPAITGDGPNAGNNAAFIAASRTMLPAAVAAIEAALALHRAVMVYGLADDCGCSEGDPDWDDHHYSTDVTGDLLCDKSPTGEHWCGECSQDENGDGTTYPCPTVAALDGLS